MLEQLYQSLKEHLLAIEGMTAHPLSMPGWVSRLCVYSRRQK